MSIIVLITEDLLKELNDLHTDVDIVEYVYIAKERTVKAYVTYHHGEQKVFDVLTLPTTATDTCRSTYMCIGNITISYSRDLCKIHYRMFNKNMSCMLDEFTKRYQKPFTTPLQDIDELVSKVNLFIGLYSKPSITKS